MRRTEFIAFFLLAAGFAGGYYMGKGSSKPEIERVEVEKVKYRERVVTEIKERPDGTKTTVITQNIKKDDAIKRVESLNPPKKWHISLSAPPTPNPRVTLQVERRIHSELFLGVYGRTDGELGVTFGFSF